MTQLDGNISSSDTVIVVDTGSEQDNGFRFRIDDEILTFLGYDRDSTADILGYLGGDRTRWRVARAQDGTTAASHLSGADLLAVAPAFATSEDLTAPDPFAAGGATPTLAEVLAEGNDPNGIEIHAADGATAIGGYASWTAADEGVSGGNATLSSGTLPGKLASQVIAGGAYVDGEDTIEGTLTFTTGGTTGAAGQVIAGGSGDYAAQALWTALITVQSPTPDTTYITPLVLADAGLYAWTGSAYTKIGDTPS